MVKKLNVQFELKSVDDNGYFEGYGSTFGDVDLGKDVVAKGAFKKSLDNWHGKQRLPAMLWQHDAKQPIGVYSYMREDEKGLYVKGQLALKTQKGAEAHELMKMNALGGLSIGYVIKDDSYDSKTGVRELKEVDLHEISVVTFPMNPNAEITAVKEQLRLGELPTERELEKFLRDAGLSRTQSTALVAGGYKALQNNLSDSDDQPEGQTDADIKSALESLLNKLNG